MTQEIQNLVIKHYSKLISDYLQVKKGNHEYFKNCKQLYRFYHTSAKQVGKYLKRLRASNFNPESLLPQKRGPKLGSRRTPRNIERNIIKAYRKLGYSRYELVLLFKPYYKDITPSPTTMYRITRRYPLNDKEKQIIKRYEKKYPGELGHVDAYYLPKDSIRQTKEMKGYLAGLLDDCTRIAYSEWLDDIKAETIGLFILRALSWFKQTYGIEFESIMSDNGMEFTARTKSKSGHFVELVLQSIGVKHKYTKPYRPQTNGKIEAFWKIVYREFLRPNYYQTKHEFVKNLGNFLLEYNHIRRHGGLKYITPYEKLKSVTELLD